VVGIERRVLGWGLVASGVFLFLSPVRRHRGLWTVSVGDRPPVHRAVKGGKNLPAARVALQAVRAGKRRPDAEWRSVLGVLLIASGVAVSLVS
jgi:hypothetical protein